MQAKITIWGIKFQDPELELIVSWGQKGIPVPLPRLNLGFIPSSALSKYHALACGLAGSPLESTIL